MQFKDVIGQNSIKQRLIQAVEEDRIPHAQLLAGPQGNGKLALALAFAQYINCPNKQHNDSCGVCSSCRKYAKLIHPDLHFTIPVIKTTAIDKPTSSDYMTKWRQYFLENPYPQYEKWMQIIADENKQGAIYVEEAKDLIHKLNQKSYEAEYKVSIIWLPETMNITCANKILKILEEPPTKTIFILISEAEEKLLSTIRSRCQFIRVPKISDHDLQIAITNNAESINTNPATIARLARGNYFMALEIMQNDELRSYNFRQFTLIMRNGYSRKLQEILTWSEEIAGIGRVRQMGFLKYCGEFLRENFLFNLKEPDLIYMDDQENEFSQKCSPFINEKNVLSLFREFEKAYTDISMNGNAKLIFTDLGLKVSKLIRL
ncbi:MAG: DNA polymerase III subunit [Bacteroidia bacterium]|nr:DNA polymerase III subunit [Bacteroidia bacterium]